MCARLPSLDAGIAEAPGALEAVVAIPVARVGECEAGFAECALFEESLGRSCEVRLGVATCHESVRSLKLNRPAFRGRETPPTFVCHVPIAVPMITSSPFSVA